MALKFLNNGYFAGKVGIGIQSPTVPLDVSGVIKTTTSFVGNAVIINQVTAATSSGRILFKNNSGSDKMAMEDNGNFGIGTTSPNQLLELKKTSGTVTARLHADHESSPATGIEFMRGTSDTWGGDAYTDWKIGNGSTQADFAITSKDSTRGENERVTIEYDTGNVGIGTTSPGEKLEVAGTGDLSFKINNTQYSRSLIIEQGGGYSHLKTSHVSGIAINYGQGNAGILSLFNNTTQAVKINANGDSYFNGGNVGIGTTAPSQKLHISGNMRLTGAFRDRLNSQGAANYVLTSTGSNGTQWVDASGSSIIGGPYLPLTAGSTKPLSGNLHFSAAASYMFGGDDEILAGQDGSGYYYATGNGQDLTKPVFIGDNNAYIRFKSGNSERMRITNTGNVGIGTTNPSQKLEVNGAVLAGDYRGSAQIYLTSPDSWIFRSTGGSERMRITSAGNVGINTTSPLTKLQITAANASSPTANIFLDIDGSNTPGMGGQIIFGASTSGTLTDYIARIQGVRSALDNGSSDLHFQTTHVSTATGPTTKMTILSDGNVGIGTTIPDSLLELENSPAAQTKSRLLHIDNNPINNQGSGYIEISSGSNNQAKTQIEQVSSGGFGLLGNQYIDTNIINRGLSSSAHGNINFATGSNTSATSIVMTIGGGSQKGNVGIGTTTPTARLDVRLSAATGKVAELHNNTGYGIGFTVEGDGGVNTINSESNQALAFATNGASNERMRITSSGTVLINATTPRESASKFSVQGGMSEFETTLSNNDDWQNSPISILERANIGSGSTADKYAPNLNFHWSAVSSNSLWMGANGNLNYGSYSGAGTPAVNGTFATGNLVAASAITGNTGAFTGQVTGPTPTTTTSFANKAYVDAHGGGLGPFLPLAGGTMTGDLKLNDAVVAKFGTGDDLRIQHTGNQSYIQNYTGDLQIQNRAADKDILFRADDGSGVVTSYLVLDGSTTHAYFSNPGNVGIGTTSPTAAKLVVDSSTAPQILVKNSSGNNAQILFEDNSGGSQNASIKFDQASQNTLTIETGYNSPNNTNRIYLAPAGDVALTAMGGSGGSSATKVGIGTTTPTAKLHVAGTGLFTGLVSGITPVNAANFVTKAYVDGSGGGTGPFLPLAGGTMTGNVKFNDNVFVKFGNQPDFEIGHDASNSYITHSGVGNLIIQNTEDNADIIFKSDNGLGGVTEYFTVDGANEVISFQKHTKHEDNVTANFGNASDLQIYHSSSNNISFITNSNAAGLRLQSNELRIFANNGSTIRADFNTAVKLYHNDIKKFETGIVSVGTATTAGGTLIDGWKTTTQANAINDTTIATTAYVNNKIALIPAGLVFQGTWNAASNSPTLTSGSGTTGNFYIVSTPGNTNLDGITDWKVGDWAVFIEQGASDQWEKIDNSSVLDGIGTGQTLPLWSGSGTSNTLTNSRFSQSATANIITGPGNAATDKSLVVGSAGNTEQFYIQGTGEVVVTQNYFYVSASQGAYINGILRARSGVTDDTGTLGLGGNGQVDNLVLNSNTSATFAGDVTVGHDLKMPTNGEIDWNAGAVKLVGTADNIKLQGGSLSITEDGSNAATLTESGSGDFEIHAQDDLRLNAGGHDIVLKGASNEFGRLTNSSQNFVVQNTTSDKDIIFKGNDGGSTITALTLDMSDAGKATFNNGWSSDGQATEYTWRIPNTGSNDGHWYKIARVTSIQSTRFKLQMVGGHSYSDGYYSSEVNAYGQLNNDNNYDLIFHKLEADNQGGDPIISFGQVDIDTSSTDLYVRLNTFAELVITASISNGNLYPDDTSTGSSTTPTNFVAALEQFGVLSPTIFQSTVRLDSQLLDGTNDAGTSGQVLSSTGSVTNWIDVPDTGAGVYLPLAGGTMNSGATIGMTGSLTIDGGGSSTDVLKLKGSARIQIENASATDSIYISNTGGSGASTLDLGGALSLVENGNATFTGTIETTKVRSDIMNNKADSANIIYRSGTNTIVGNHANALVIEDSGSIGIGTATPDTDGYSFAEDLVIKGGASASDGAGITIAGNGKRYGVIAFGDAADVNAGEIFYDHTANSMHFRTNGSSTLLNINSSGDVQALGKLTVNGSAGINVDSATHASVNLDRASNSYDNNLIYRTNGAIKWRLWQDGSDDFLYIRDEANASNIVSFKTGGDTTFAGNVGIGTTSPSYKLTVSGGGIQAGGKVTYTKSAGSLNTTGYAVAGITADANGNGSSCGFTFTCFGHLGGYQKIVYSCYNDSGTWNAKKVINEGTNQLDVVASANGSTITFTFKAISSTMHYTPRVTVEATGNNINSTYA